MRDPHGYRMLAFLFAIPAGIVLAALVAGNWVREMASRDNTDRKHQRKETT